MKLKPPLKENKINIELMAPTQEPIVAKRKISYIEQDQAFTSIRLAKDYLNEFSFLKEKMSNYDFICLMKLHKKFEVLKKDIEELEKQGIMPLLCLIGKEKKEE